MAGLAFIPRGPVLFRDNRSFTTGGVAHARFPLPSVFYGALRTRFLIERQIDFQRYAKPREDDSRVRGEIWKAIGSPEKDGELQVKGPFPYARGQWLFPPPENRWPENDYAVPVALTPGECSDLDAQSLRPVMRSHIADNEVLQDWLPEATLKTYLLWGARDVPAVRSYLDRAQCFDSIEVEDIFVSEVRYGHRRDPQTLRPADEQLYSLEMLRAEERMVGDRLSRAGWGVVVEGLADDQIPGGAVWVGGRSRRCDLERANGVPDFGDIRTVLLAAITARKRCFWYLGTSAIFDEGFRPSAPPGLHLVGAAVGRTIAAGGWNLARNRARPTRRLAPAGSVYFFEGQPADGWETFLDRYQFAAVSDERQASGFGIALVGCW